MKGKLIIISALALSLLLAGCNSDNNEVVEDNTAPVEDAVEEIEEETEDAVEEVEEEAEELGDETEEVVDEVEDEIEEETAEVWPADFMSNVPEFEQTIFKINEKDAKHMYVAFEDVSQEDAVEYVETLKDAGFSNDADQYIASTVVNFKGYDENGNFAKFRWSENGYATIDMIYPEEE